MMLLESLKTSLNKAVGESTYIVSLKSLKYYSKIENILSF